METLFYSITDDASRLNAISAEPRNGASLRRSNSFFPDGIRFERSLIETALKLAAMVLATIGFLMATSLFTVRHHDKTTEYIENTEKRNSVNSASSVVEKLKGGYAFDSSKANI
jgi:hypothetical protein